jgi:hypothetical protein
MKTLNCRFTSAELPFLENVLDETTKPVGNNEQMRVFNSAARAVRNFCEIQKTLDEREK